MGSCVTPAPGHRMQPAVIGIDAQILRRNDAGVGRTVRALLKHLPREAPDLRFVVYHGSRFSAPHNAEETPVQYRTALLPTSSRAIRIGWQQTVLPWRLRTDHIDLLHSPAYTGPLLTKVPSVLSIYDTIALQFPELSKRLTTLHYRLFMTPSAHRAARIIVPSQATRDDVIGMFNIDGDKVQVIPLAVSEDFRPVENPEMLQNMCEELNLPSRYILFVGNLEPKKNLPALIEAYAAAHRSGRITHRLVIAGQKGWRCADVFSAVKRLRLEGIVRFLGRVPDRLLPALYSGAALTVLPSLTEGFGFPALEAMACGTPVIVSTSGALPEVTGGAALTVRPTEIRELTAAMEKVLTNTFLRERLRELGLKRAKEFSWAKTAQQTAAVYREVLGARNAAKAQ